MCVISGCRKNKQFKFEAFTTIPGQKLQVNFPVLFDFGFLFCFVLSVFGHFAGCKESQFYSLPFGQAVANMY